MKKGRYIVKGGDSMRDEDIISLLFERSENGISAMQEKYGASCHRLALGILGDERDAEECVSDAYLAIWNRIPPEKPDPLSAFLYKILRNLSLKKYREKKAKKRSGGFEELLDELEEFLPSAETTESRIEQKELTRVIEAFLDTLTPENRNVFLRRYWFAESYEQISKATGYSKSNVSMRLLRTKEKMRIYLTERGVEI